ncbi:hypothetical protein DM02DRAFT_52095 [Periconia macrospinosa]|uniref:F-box domain-containing protein n=1 Tax=Periconia macrospinosa TaxID=97972 RepID=A0A2V1DLZ4_9PLEO|nr:hypothetical protein DM02DRAFT_52095 [Periconia macrospinosa]
MRAPIECLPLELIDLIVAQFSLSDYQSIRLSSKHLVYLTLSSFCDRFFTRRTTTLASPSLDRLLRVSKCRHLADKVLFLDVKLLNRADYESLQQISRVGIYPPPKRFPRVPHVKLDDIKQEAELFEYMRHSKDPKTVTDKLARALRHLRNLRTVRMRVNGATLSSVPSEVYDDHEFLAASFRAVSGALLKSELMIEQLYTSKGTSIRATTKSANLNYSAFILPVPLTQAFCSLRSLSLSLCTDSIDSRVPGWERNISRFISAAPALEELVLCTQLNYGMYQWRIAVVRSLARSVRLSNLRNLQLHGFHVSEADMKAFIHAHSHALRNVTIRKCHMQEGTWGSLIASFKGLDLEYLRMVKLQQESIPKHMYWTPHGGGKRNKIVLDIRGKLPSKRMDEMLVDAVETLVPSVPLHEFLDS